MILRLDNKIPRIAVNPIVGEVSGDVEISYEVVNDTLSEVVLVPEYFFDGSVGIEILGLVVIHMILLLEI